MKREKTEAWSEKKTTPEAGAPSGTERFPQFFAGSLLLPLFVSGISGPGQKKENQ